MKSHRRVAEDFQVEMMMQMDKFGASTRQAAAVATILLTFAKDKTYRGSR